MGTMSYLADPETFWLNVTNIALGLATIIFLGILVRAVFRDVWQHHKNRRSSRTN